MSGDIERRRAVICQVMASKLDQRRIAHRSAFFVERTLLPTDLDIRVGALFEKLLGKLDGAEVACRRGRAFRSIADAGGAVGAGFAEERQRVERRSARIRSVRVGAMVQQY